jgi:hypothetical protein
MIIAQCFTAITSGALSAVVLWPSSGALSLVAVPFVSSAASILASLILSYSVRPR